MTDAATLLLIMNSINLIFTESSGALNRLCLHESDCFWSFCHRRCWNFILRLWFYESNVKYADTLFSRRDKMRISYWHQTESFSFGVFSDCVEMAFKKICYIKKKHIMYIQYMTINLLIFLLFREYNIEKMFYSV